MYNSSDKADYDEDKKLHKKCIKYYFYFIIEK